MAVRIVTDSTSDLTPEVARELGITVVPCNVHFGTEVYRDGIDLGAEEFYRGLVKSAALPTTSQPSVGIFAQVYGELARETEDILSIHISAKLSGTLNSALLGRQEVEGKCRIEVMDSQQCSMGLGLIAIAAAGATREGASLDQAAQLVNRIIPCIHTFFMVDTLEYLEKGGRIGKAQAFLGTMLKVKPLLTIKDGEAHPLERVRTRARAVDRLCELAAGFSSIKDMAVMHSATSEEAEEFARRLSPLLPQGRIYMATCGPVIGTYVGPGALGVAVREGD